MPQIVTPKKIKALTREFTLKSIRPINIYDIKMSSIQELLELADSYGVKIVMQLDNQYIFKHEGFYYYAKG